MKSRVIIIFLGIFLCWALLFLRAGYLQFLPNDRLIKLREKQFNTVITLQARRGSILDRNGRELAMSSKAQSLYIDPKLIEKPKHVAHKLARILGVSFESIYSKTKDSTRRFAWIQRLISDSAYQKIKALNLRGVSFVEEWRRIYPNDSLFAHSLGFLGSEGQGLAGLELAFNKDLTGNNKRFSVRRDARGRPLSVDGMLFTENPDGNDVYLTIDSDLQYMVESELKKTADEFEAHSAFAVILDPRNAEILAMASYPNFDANQPLHSGDLEERRNRVLSEIIEPGSTFKTFVVAEGLRRKILKPNKKYFCENGSFKIGKRVIHEAEASHSFGNLTVTEILAYSSNIGTSKIAFELGEERLYEGLENFGFGTRVGDDLPGEAKGIFPALPWKQHLLSNISFGQGIGTTPLQVANAYAVIANGGIFNAPTIIKSIRQSETGDLVDFQKKSVGRRVLSPEDALAMRAMLSAVTGPGGTGVNAKVDGFIVAGKTGTAQIANPRGGGYLKGAYLSSFAGMIPADSPRFVIYVGVSQPKKAYYGSQVAAPLFAKIASYSVRKEGLIPTILPSQKLIATDLKKSESTNLNSKFTELGAASGVLSDTKQGIVPDLRTLTLREVIQQLRGQNYKFHFKGEGRVSEINPMPGESIAPDGDLFIQFK